MLKLNPIHEQGKVLVIPFIFPNLIVMQKKKKPQINKKPHTTTNKQNKQFLLSHLPLSLSPEMLSVFVGPSPVYHVK